MNFGAEYYIPVLKLKRGEKRALRQLAPAIQQRMLPLLEVVERRAPPDRLPPSLPDHIDTAFDGLPAAVAPYPRFLLDCREIASDGSVAAAGVFARAATLGATFTPVTGITRTVDVAVAMLHRRNGIALRLTRAEFEAGHVPTLLPAFMRKHSLTPEDTDLVVDLGPVDDMIPAGIEALIAAFLSDVPNRTQWRTLTVSACAFPQSMGGVDASSSDLVDRAEWRAWRDGLHANRQHLDRLPTFSDCAIQHPTGVEGFDPRIMPVSASIRLTVHDEWLLIKGVSTRNIPARIQFPSLARQLVYGNLRQYFAGANHCAGCENMVNAANGAPRLGSPEVWRRLGTIHHLTRAVEMVGALSWP